MLILGTCAMEIQMYGNVSILLIIKEKVKIVTKT